MTVEYIKIFLISGITGETKKDTHNIAIENLFYDTGM